MTLLLCSPLRSACSGSLRADCQLDSAACREDTPAYIEIAATLQSLFQSIAGLWLDSPSQALASHAAQLTLGT